MINVLFLTKPSEYSILDDPFLSYIHSVSFSQWEWLVSVASDISQWGLFDILVNFGIFINIRKLFVGEDTILAVLLLVGYLYGVTPIDEFVLLLDELDFIDKV